MTELIEILKDVRATVGEPYIFLPNWQQKLRISRRLALDDLIAAEEAADLSSASTEIETQWNEIHKLEGILSAADSHLDEVEEAVDLMNDGFKLLRRVISN